MCITKKSENSFKSELQNLIKTRNETQRKEKKL